MSRRERIAAMALGALLSAASGWGCPESAPRVFLLNPQKVAAARRQVAAGNAKTPALERLRRRADRALRMAPVTVTSKPMLPPSGDKHDYMSLAPYWWPDPKSKTGLPYIRRDGERNPERLKIEDHQRFDSIMSAVPDLALAYCVFQDERYAEQAGRLLRAWFLDPATRMNPNLNYAQAILGRTDGRGAGLIETRYFPRILDALGLLDGAKSWTAADQKGMSDWIAQYFQWLQQSKNGRDEAKAENNHGTWYDGQVIAIALFTGNQEQGRKMLEGERQRIAAQIKPSGQQPLELARTNAFSYSTMNLLGWFEVAMLGERANVDLWKYQTADERGLQKALDYLTPFAAGEHKWPHQQIAGLDPAALAPLLAIAGDRYGSEEYRKLAEKLDAGVLLEPEVYFSLP